MLRIAIVEDDPQDLERLQGCLQQFSRERKRVFDIYTYKNGILFLEQKEYFDIIFMDIEMPHMTGMETAKRLREINEMSCLIFVTNMAQYAIGGYSVGAMDYILKPVEYGSFAFRLERALKHIVEKQDMVMIKTKAGMVSVAASDITWVESRGHRIIYHTTMGSFETWDTISRIEERMGSDSFARCNSGYLINLKYVNQFDGASVTVAGDTLKVSEGKRKKFQEALMRAMNGMR